MLDFLAAATGAGAQPAWAGWLPIVGMILIFWFLIIRPQMRQQKAHTQKISGLKRGDEVVTAGGLIGRIIKVEEDFVEIELAKGVRVRAVRNTIGDVLTPGDKPAAND